MIPKDPHFKFLGKFEVIFPEEIYYEKRLFKIFEKISKIKNLKKIPKDLQDENLDDILSVVIPNKKYDVIMLDVVHTISCECGWETLLEEHLLPINFSELSFILEKIPIDTTVFLPNEQKLMYRYLDGMSTNDRAMPGVIQTSDSIEILCFDLFSGAILGENTSDIKNIIIGLKEI